MRVRTARLWIIGVFLFLLPMQGASAETVEEYLNNLVGPKEQYGTYLSPVYLRTNTTEYNVSPQSGELTVAQTDYVLPGRNGLDLEIKRIYKSGNSNVQEMKARYRSGSWVDYVESNETTSTFYEDRYNLGVGMRFSFPSMEIRKNNDGTSHKFLHTESGDVYRLEPQRELGEQLYLPEGQTVEDVTVIETEQFSNGQEDGTSKYMMVSKDGKKHYFAEDGRLLAIQDRYGNQITFEYQEYINSAFTIPVKKKFLSKIIDTVGREVTITYKEDYTYKVKPQSNPSYNANNSWRASQHPNTTDSGDLEGKFQVVIQVPGGKEIVYDKTAMLISPEKYVLRTRLQRVFDVDGGIKYHYWYEQPDLGFRYVENFNYNKYYAYIRYEHLVQIDYTRTNQIKRFLYDTHEKTLNTGSMEYRKISELADLAKTGYDTSKEKFLDKFITQAKSTTTYTYTNEPDGYGVADYKQDDEKYLKEKYRYYTETTDLLDRKVKYTYNGEHELLETERVGRDHKEQIVTERDEMKLVKKQETFRHQVQGGKESGKPVRVIENFRYDKYGNLTNYAGPEANRDEHGELLDLEHMVVYSYAYDKFHMLSAKTWKQNADTTSQVLYEIDNKGNVVKETHVNAADSKASIIHEYAYDAYGNLTKSVVDGTFETRYEYGVDAAGVDTKGAYLTRKTRVVNGESLSHVYGYDFATGNLKQELDAKGNRTAYQHDVYNRVTRVTRADGSSESFVYEEKPYANLTIRRTDPNGSRFAYTYDIHGYLLDSKVLDKGSWQLLKRFEYDAASNVTKEVDANGHSIRYVYDSLDRLVEKSHYSKDTVNRGSQKLAYTYQDGDIALVVQTTDEEGYIQKYSYDRSNRLIKHEMTPDNKQWLAKTYTYDYVGNKLSETDARQQTRHYRYDSFNRLVEAENALGAATTYAYNGLDKLIQQVEPGGRTIAYDYDTADRLLAKRVYQAGSSDYTFTRYVYDSADNVIEMKVGSHQNGQEHLAAHTRYSYNNMHRVVTEAAVIDESRTGLIAYEYDKNGNKTKETHYTDAGKLSFREYAYTYDFAGQETRKSGAYKLNGGTEVQSSYTEEYERDYAGNLVAKRVWNGTAYETASYWYDHRNMMVKKEEPFGVNGEKAVTEYSHDKAGRTIAEVLLLLGLAVRTTYGYDGMGRKTKQTDALGNTTRYAYDANGNVIKTVDARYMDTPLDRAPGIVQEYDAENRLVRTLAFDGQTSTVIAYKHYDGRGNVILEADAAGYNAANPGQSIGQQSTYDANNHRTTVITAQQMADNRLNGGQHPSWTYTYDALGNRLTERDAAGNLTRYTYYLNGALREVAYADGSKQSYDHDLTGKARTVVTDQAGFQTTTLMNIFDQPYRIAYPDGTQEQFSYSVKGLLTHMTDRAGNGKWFTYDQAGNVVSMREFVRQEGNRQVHKLTENKYDEAKQLLQRETFTLTTSAFGDILTKVSLGDRIHHVYDKAGRLTEVKGPGDRRRTVAYDRAGNVIVMKDYASAADPVVRRYTYDFRSQLTTESLLVNSADLHNEVLAKAQFDREYLDRLLATTRYSYYGNGSLKSMTDGNGHTTHYEYDLDGRLTKKTDPLHAATSYRYDAVGNLVEEINALGESKTYAYDGMNRLVRETNPYTDGGTATIRYVYDNRGNLIKQIAPNDYEAAKDTAADVGSMIGISYTYDSMNRRITTTSPDGKLLERVAYDANGNVSKVVDGLRYNGDMAASPGTVYSYDGLSHVVQVKDALGRLTKYSYDVLGRLASETDANNHITRYTYKSDGTLASIAYPDGAAEAYAYDGLGRMTQMTDPRGNVTRYRYNAFGELAVLTNALGHTEEYKYDLAGNILSHKDPRGSITSFAYDRMNRLVEKRMPKERDASGNIVYAIEATEYDKAGRVTVQRLASSHKDNFLRTRSFTYYANGLLHTESDNNGGSTSYAYDMNGNVIRQERLREGSAADITTYAYDASNRLLKQMEWIEEELLSNSLGADAFDRLRNEQDPSRIQRITGYAYDRLGNKIREWDPRAYMHEESGPARLAYETRYTYDALNRIVRMTRMHEGEEVYSAYTYDAVGNVVSMRNERGDTTTYSFDERNRTTKITDPLGKSMSYTYDGAGNKISETNANGSVMTYNYDPLNRLVAVIDPFDVMIEKRVYDANGNLLKKMDALGILSAATDDKRYGWTYTYNLANEMVTAQDPVFADKTAFTEKYTYNPAGEIIAVTDASGNELRYNYDNAGNLIEVIDQNGASTQYLYDKAGNKVYMIDGRGKVTRYAYGSFGTMKAVTDANNKTVTYLYDLALNRTVMLDRMGHHTRYVYDSQNRLVEMSVDETKDKITYAYDALGNRVKMEDASGTSTYTYDMNSRMLTVVKDGERQLTYTYDDIGNMTSVVDATGYTTTYTYDASSRMKTVTFDGKTTTYSYDLNGNREKITYPGDVKEVYTFDKSNRLLSLLNKKANGTVLSKYDYTYDVTGRQSSKTDSFGTTRYTYDPVGRVLKVEAPGKTTLYSYDKAGNRQSQQETYTSAQPSGYFEPHNKQEVEYVTKKSEYLYNNLNQLVTLTEYMYDGTERELLKKTTSYLYDANGSEIRQRVSYLHPHDATMRQVTDGEAYGNTVEDTDLNTLIEKVTSTYDGFNRLKTMEKVKHTQRTTVSYAYDGDGLRTEKRVRSSSNNYAEEVTRYLYDRQYVILERDAEHKLLTRFVRGVNYIARMDDSRTSYYLFNGHGDVVQTVSEAGEIENQYDYDIFGNPILTIEIEYKSAIRYAGEFFEEETGLYYLRARFYNPYIGRFISEDSYWGEDKNPLSLNRYTYAHNDPVQYVDPSGHFAALLRPIGGIVIGRVIDYVVDQIGNKSNKEKSDDKGSSSSSSSGSSSGSSSSITKIVDIAKEIYYSYIYGNATDYSSEQQTQEAVLLNEQNAKGVFARQERYIALLDQEIERLGEERRILEQKIKEQIKHTEKLKQARDQLVDLGADIRTIQTDLHSLKVRSEFLIAHSKELISGTDQIVSRYEYLNNLDWTEEEEDSFFSSFVGSLAWTVGEGLLDTVDFALYAIEDPLGAGKATVDGIEGIVQTAVGVAAEIANDPVGAYHQAVDQTVQGVKDFKELSPGEMGAVLGVLTGEAIQVGRKQLIPDKGWIDGKSSRGAGDIPTWKGSGPTPGVIGVNSSSKSVEALKNYNPKNGGVEFVFDAKTNTFVVGTPKSNAFQGSAHEKLAQTIKADGGKTTLGGTFSRGPNGEFITTENSGHFGKNWTPQLRQQFQDSMKSYGIEIQHQKWVSP